MARRTATPPPPATERIIDVDVSAEMETSFLEYAYSVIYARALPDARDGLKPVQRRILFQMAEMGLRPDRGHVKSARVVGEVMGRLHPHGDSAIYDALVRMAQPFSMRVPMVDGHGNFGSLGNDDPPAAMRYTECRLTSAALAMTESLDEDVVAFVPNYDGQEMQPEVLPAAVPGLLVNGASGIAVGMSTSLPPHNLVEVVAAAKHLLATPNATTADLMRFVPGPDLPTGGTIAGLDGIREAYETGKGSFRIRARTRVENVTPRRRGIVVTELPYGVGPERVIARISELVRAKKLVGISDITDLTDGERGLRLVIELKSGINPEPLLEQLFRMTPLEETFSVNAVALVDGQPRTLGLKELLRVYLDHRIEVVRRRSEFRRRRAQDRLHLVEGLLTAILDIDEVIQVIRTSDDAGAARQRLIEIFELSEIQASHILEMPLRRLTKFSRLELDKESEDLQRTIAELTELLDDEARLRDAVAAELSAVAESHGTPRRTVLLEAAAVPSGAVTPLEVTDDPCWVLLGSTGLLARTADDSPLGSGGARAKHDVILSVVATTARGDVGLLTSKGRVLRLHAVDLPALPPTADAPSLAGGAPIGEFVDLQPDERVLALTSLAPDSLGLALGTANGTVKRVQPDHPSRDSWEVITLKPGDEVVGALELQDATQNLVLISSDGQLLTFGADAVRPQGRAAGGVAGMRVADGARLVFFGVAGNDGEVVTIAGSSAALPGTQPGAAKVTPLAEYPAKGRGTGGVRCHRFRKGEDTLLIAWAGSGPARAAAASGAPVPLPEADPRRDGAGIGLEQPIAAIAGSL